MRGFLSTVLCTFFIASVGSAVAQVKTKIVFVDANYRTVSKERMATYKVESTETRDSVFFETYSLAPKGKIEAGRYAKGQGNDLRNCYLVRYWPNGMVQSKGFLKQSWNDGLWEFFDEEGKIYSEITYTDGLIDGDVKRYYSSGLVRTYSYIKNKREGESFLFDSSGRIFNLSSWQNDSLHGDYLEFSETGNLKRKAVYGSGVLLRDTQFYDDGKPFNCEAYDSAGQIHGKCIMYTPSGKIARYDEYSHGNLLQNICLHPLADADYEGDDCPPRKKELYYPGGMEKFHEFVASNQDYPEDAMKWKKQGVAQFTIQVNRYGAVVEINEENLVPLGYGLEKECMRLLEKLKKFEPMQLNGKNISCYFTIPFVFIL